MGKNSSCWFIWDLGSFSQSFESSGHKVNEERAPCISSRKSQAKEARRENMGALAWVLRGGLGISAAGLHVFRQARRTKIFKYAAPVDLIPGAVGFVGLGIDFRCGGITKNHFIWLLSNSVGSGTWWYLRKSRKQILSHRVMEEPELGPAAQIPSEVTPLKSFQLSENYSYPPS